MQKTLTKEELVARLNGRQYREEITPEEERLAKENNLLVIFGSSDDLVELRGAINEELGFESVIRIGKSGVPKNDCDNDECPYHAAQLKRDIQRGLVRELKVFLGGKWQGQYHDPVGYRETGRPTWCFGCENLNGKFATFDIFDEYEGDKEYFCRGVVVDLDEIFPSKNYAQIVLDEGGWEP